MYRLRSDLLEACEKAVSGELKDYHLEFDERVALGVVMAAGGYPVEYETVISSKVLTLQHQILRFFMREPLK